MEKNMIKLGLHLVAGAYLVYLGINSFRGMQKGELDAKWYFILLSVVFIAAGAATFLNAIRLIVKQGGITIAEDENKEDEEGVEQVPQVKEEAEKGIEGRLKALQVPDKSDEKEQ